MLKFSCWGMVTIAAIFTLMLAACGSGRGTNPSLSEVLFDPKATWSEKHAYFFALTLGSGEWHKRWWIEKTARLLRGGKVISPDDQVDDLMKLSEQEIIRKFMADVRFGDTMLDLNMYTLGFKLDSVRDLGDEYNFQAFELANAIISAQETLRGGDYFRLFDLQAPIFVHSLKALSPAENDPEEAALKPEEVRRHRIGKLLKDLDDLVSYTKSDGALLKEACNKLAHHESMGREMANGRDLPFTPLFKGPVADGDWYPSADDVCRKQDTKTLDDLSKALEKIRERDHKLFAEILKFEAPAYSPKNINEFRAFDAKAATLQGEQVAFGFEGMLALQNSSTNSDRKRAAWVLKHFFCDDLNPVGVEDPNGAAVHAGDAHASEPSCRACHYKLDPMAGFFRNYGLFFIDYSRMSYLVFDDGVVTSPEKYAEQWKAPAESGRKWNIGYVRSTTKPAENSYGESFADLSKILRQAPETKRCMVKRMFEYFIAENQTIDAGYLDYLTELFQKDAETNSSVAVKNTIARLLMSNSYNAGNLEPAQCYDFRPGEDQTNRPPCRVAFLLRQCDHCHNSTLDAEFKYLDLSSWVTLADGTQTFPHLDEKGKQRTARETFALIVDRLTTNDPKSRMPLKRSMTSQDRQELVLWAQDVLAKLPEVNP